MVGWLKWLAIVLVLLGLLGAGFIYYQTVSGNPAVARELAANPDGERAGIVMMLTVEAGKTLPVNYLREGDVVFVGADGPWWRSFRDGGAPVSLVIRGEKLNGHAVVVLDDPVYTREVFARLRPTAPSWLPAWLNGKLVVITLRSNS